MKVKFNFLSTKVAMDLIESGGGLGPATFVLLKVFGSSKVYAEETGISTNSFLFQYI